MEYRPLNGSSCIELPQFINRKEAVLNIKNVDKQCFKWYIAIALNMVERDAQKITKILRTQPEKLNWSRISFPVKLTDISKFEKQN